jgi:hypothetical protein
LLFLLHYFAKFWVWYGFWKYMLNYKYVVFETDTSQNNQILTVLYILPVEYFQCFLMDFCVGFRPEYWSAKTNIDVLYTLSVFQIITIGEMSKPKWGIKQVIKNLQVVGPSRKRALTRR